MSNQLIKNEGSGLESHHWIDSWDSDWNVELQMFPVEYLGYGIHKSTCKACVWRLDSGATLVVMVDIGKGTSVTNASETIANKIRKALSLDPVLTVWLECYPEHGAEFDIDRVSYSLDDHNQLHRPQWSRVTDERIIKHIRKTVNDI